MKPTSTPDFILAQPQTDYRAIRFILLDRKPRTLWGMDFFVWHIPLLKTTLVLDALIVWWLQ